MSRSEKWQKFYKWYSLISIVLVALVGLLVIIGSGWAAQQEMLLTLALDLSMALFALTVTGGDLLLWAVSVVVWCSMWIGMTPQDRFICRTVVILGEQAMMGQGGRYFEIARAVLPIRVTVTIALAFRSVAVVTEA